jgi:hypothetical protein
MITIIKEGELRQLSEADTQNSGVDLGCLAEVISFTVREP